MNYQSLECKKNWQHQFYAREGELYKDTCPKCGG